MSCCGEGKLGKVAHGAAGLVKAAGHAVYINRVPIAVIDHRVNACKTCEHGGANWFCGQCGCLIGAKIRVKDEKCPIGRWEVPDAS